MPTAASPSTVHCPTCKGYGFITFIPAGVNEEHIRNFTQYTKPCPMCYVLPDERIQWLRKLCRVPDRYRNATIADFRTTAETAHVPGLVRGALSADNKGKSSWVTLHGAPGVGKTLLLCAAVNEAISANRSAVYVTMADLLDHLRRSFDPKSTVSGDAFWTALQQSEVVALDEVDRFNPTPWAREKFFELTNHRYNYAGVTLFATNKPVGEGRRLLEEESVPYFESRITSGVIVHVKGIDRRPFASWQDDSNV